MTLPRLGSLGKSLLFQLFRKWLVFSYCIALFFSPLSSGAWAAEADVVIKRILEEKQGFACLSMEEVELLNYVNLYRKSNGLPVIQNSRSLNKVARIHAVDLAENYPESATDARGLACNLHSWSSKGSWSPVCYTGDHYYLEKMIKKPIEITKYAYFDVAYENVYWTSVDVVFPYRVMDAWKKSPAHKNLILELGKWKGIKWNALGIGIYKNIATIWVGSLADPLGPLSACDATMEKVK